MAANKPGKAEILAAFFDDGTYSPLFTDGAVSAAYGCANGQNAYVVFEGVQDIEKNIRVLEMAAETGAPVVTFYDSTGAKLEGGLDLLNANARLTAEIARVSGVVPQVAVVTGTCAGTNAINAAAADVCVMAEDAELFLNAPFNAEDKVANAGSAVFAAKAGVAAVTAADAVAAAKQAAMNEMNSKGHLRQTKGSNAKGDVPEEIRREYKIYFPNATDAEIAEMYWKNQKATE